MPVVVYNIAHAFQPHCGSAGAKAHILFEYGQACGAWVKRMASAQHRSNHFRPHFLAPIVALCRTANEYAFSARKNVGGELRRRIGLEVLQALRRR
jgi:hypothetical protein